MKRVLTGAILLALTCTSLFGQAATAETELVQKARKIHRDVITLDTHDDINTANFTKERNYTQDLPTQVTLPKMKSGGLDVAWFIVYTGQGPLTEEGYAAAYKNAIDKFDAIHRLTENFLLHEVIKWQQDKGEIQTCPTISFKAKGLPPATS